MRVRWSIVTHTMFGPGSLGPCIQSNEDGQSSEDLRAEWMKYVRLAVSKRADHSSREGRPSPRSFVQ